MGVFERRKVGLILTPALFVVTWFAPLGLEPRQQHLAAVFAAVIVAWVTEVMPISVTALLIAPAMIVVGVTDSRSAFAHYADPLIFLFIGGFFIARAMMRHGLDRRIARSLMSFRLVRGSPIRIRMAFMMTAIVLSMWISNTATAAILIPILLGTLPEEDDTSPGSVLAIAYAASVGGMGTLIGSPPNFITVRFLQEQAGVDFDFVQWMGIGMPAALVLVVVIGFVLQWLAPPPPAETTVTVVTSPWSWGEKVTAACFGLAVAGWTIPGIMRAVGAPHAAEVAKALPIGAVAILAAAPLFLFRDEDGKTPVLPWHDAARIDWGLILLFGGGLSLGAQMFETGLAAEISQWFLHVTGISSLWGLTAALIVFTVFFTEACSNTASSNMIVPLAIAAAVELDVSPLPPALAVGLAASCAFMLPIATGPNAVAYGTGLIELPHMMRIGFLLNIVAALTLLAVLYALSIFHGWV
ncbi:MAG: SLC13/DASS family transporter [Myxococcales bacterium]|nr:MAG: SLC13/DASS family transporter [Myxococcales bacterium]